VSLIPASLRDLTGAILPSARPDPAGARWTLAAGPFRWIRRRSARERERSLWAARAAPAPGPRRPPSERMRGAHMPATSFLLLVIGWCIAAVLLLVVALALRWLG
jgi:hypothetical protein